MVSTLTRAAASLSEAVRVAVGFGAVAALPCPKIGALKRAIESKRADSLRHARFERGTDFIIDVSELI
jgi:hypothetical protein